MNNEACHAFLANALKDNAVQWLMKSIIEAHNPKNIDGVEVICRPCDRNGMY